MLCRRDTYGILLYQSDMAMSQTTKEKKNQLKSNDEKESKRVIETQGTHSKGY
jgi:hypothetical protein